MNIEEFLEKLETGEEANFAIFGEKAFQEILGKTTVHCAKEKAVRISRKIKNLRLLVMSPEFGGVEISYN